jgi:type II secretory ATPase GspE/PulE/Tfp pilus assembly ATPase PilB-like protein/tetratricopeptide (TPR) repeat protein
MVVFAVIGCLWLSQGAVAQGAPPRTIQEIMASATQSYERQNFPGAWAELLQVHAQDAEAWKQNRPMVEGTIRGVHQRAMDLFQQGRYEQSIETALLLADENALAFASEVYPDHIGSLTTSTRRVLGEANYQLGNKVLNRREFEQAEVYLLNALKWMEPDNEQYGRVWSDLGFVQRQRGTALMGQQSPQASEVFRNATASFEKAIEYAGSNQDLKDFAQKNITELAQGVQIIEGTVPTPTPAPTPTPVPGMLESYLPSDLGTKTSAFFQNMGVSSALQDTILTVLVIVLAFILIFWVIPNYALLFIARHFDVHAADYKMKVKRLGIFALFAYMFHHFKHHKEYADEKIKNGCPHCSFNLDDFLAYEDLVFSRCPKCQGQVTPVITLEGYIKNIAKILATDVERVNTGADSVERFVGQDLMVRMVRAVITLGVRRRASDIHVEPDEQACVIRQRVDGLITEMFSLPRSLSMALVSAIKVQANLNIAERRVPQDGKLGISVDKTSIDVRVASSPASAGEKVSLRLLDGLMLVAGPTGSGKTTTLYVALQQIRPTNRNIISIEDPIEFRIPGVNQIQVNPVAGLTFASCLRSVLRQDPDVIMVGEIRDKETGEISVSSATTGHLVLSTLHTIDAAASVARLIDLGVSPRQFADALSLVLAQRLIRLVCQYCPESVQPGTDILDELGIEQFMVNKYEFRRGKGCHVCNNTGYYRRTGIFEFLVPSDRLRNALEHESLSTTEIREIAVQSGMKTLRQEALALLKNGLTTAEETLRVTK